MKLVKPFKGPKTKPFKDTDGDLTPDVIDCQPNNPRKQGVGAIATTVYEETAGRTSWGKKLGGFVKGATERYKQKRATRQEEQLEQLTKKREIAEAKLALRKTKSQISEVRRSERTSDLDLKRKQFSLEQQKQKSMPRGFGSGKAPSLFGGPSMFSGTTPGIGMGVAPVEKKVKKRRKHTKRKRKKR